MKTVILGASSDKSLGYHIGTYLEKKSGHSVVYASRSGKLGIKCDTNEPKQVGALLANEKPNLVVYAAGVYSEPQILGSFKKYTEVNSHILSKSFGALVVANAVAATPSVKTFIILGGREISSDPGFAAYSVANGALWALVSFFAKHKKTPKIYYVDLPLIKNTTMGQLYTISHGSSVDQASPETIIDTVSKIIDNKYRSGSRIIVCKKLDL